MPSIFTDQGDVHYEVIGSGPPVILLHGWTQAWNTWRSTLETFQGQYRMYAPDLWGFGESEKRRESFEVSDFVELIPQFMDGLGILKVPIMGHSMGGTTALGVALRYPERVKKVGVVGSPIHGNSLSLFLKLASSQPPPPGYTVFRIMTTYTILHSLFFIHHSLCRTREGHSRARE